MDTNGIRPPYTLYELHAEAGRPTADGPCVHLDTRELDGRLIDSDRITPDQARLYARMLIVAADEAERRALK